MQFGLHGDSYGGRQAGFLLCRKVVRFSLCSLKVLGAGCGGLWFGVNVFQGVHDQAEGQVSHVLGGFACVGVQPGFDQADASCEAEGIGVFQAVHVFREGGFQDLQTVLGDNALYAADKGHVAVGA